jgi:hypothetical protein
VEAGDPSVKLNEHASKRACLGCLALLIGIVIGCSAFVYFQFHPRNRVEVTVKNVPAETWFLCLVAETDEGMLAMNWSPWMIAPFEMAPRDCGFSYVMHRGPTIEHLYAMWKFGSRYGVVTRHPEKVWRVHWFDPADVTLEGRSFFFGEGAATFDILKSTTEQLPVEAVRELGFDDIRWDGER